MEYSLLCPINAVVTSVSRVSAVAILFSLFSVSLNCSLSSIAMGEMTVDKELSELFCIILSVAVLLLEALDCMPFRADFFCLLLVIKCLINVKGILYVWSRKKVFFLIRFLASERCVFISLEPTVVSLIQKLSTIPPFSLFSILLEIYPAWARYLLPI